MDVDLINAMTAAARRGDVSIIGSGCGDADGLCVLADGAVTPTEVSALCEIARIAMMIREKAAGASSSEPLQVVVETESRTLYALRTPNNGTVVLAQK